MSGKTIKIPRWVYDEFLKSSPNAAQRASELMTKGLLYEKEKTENKNAICEIQSCHGERHGAFAEFLGGESHPFSKEVFAQ